MNLYPFAKAVVSSVFKPLFRIEVRGTEHFPKSGGVLLCANHIDNFDPPVVGITCPRPVNFMAKEELFHVPVLKTLLPGLNAFPVKRGMGDRESLRTALRILQSGEVIGLFPEGTRSKTGELGKGLAGAGFFALKSDVAVVPCAIIGPYKPFRKLKVVYGKPLDMAPFKERRASAAEVTDAIMEEIRILIERNK